MRQTAATLGLLPTLSDCSRVPRTDTDACTNPSACVDEVTCELVADLSDIALGDTGATMQASTMACGTDEAFLVGEDRQSTDGDSGRARDQCVDGSCTAMNGI